MEKISELISQKAVETRIAEIAEQINKEYEGRDVHLICILKGSLFFTCELAKRLTMPVTIDFIQVSSYGSGTVSSGNIKIKKELDESIEGRDVIVIEDIIDSGNTLSRLVPYLQKMGPASLKICIRARSSAPLSARTPISCNSRCRSLSSSFLVS